MTTTRVLFWFVELKASFDVNYCPWRLEILYDAGIDHPMVVESFRQLAGSHAHGGHLRAARLLPLDCTRLML